MRPVAGDEWPEEPGQFKLILTPGDRRFVFGCPRGRTCAVALRPDTLPNGASWEWNGNEQSPTLTPSINCVGGCGWHGFVTNGEMTGV